MVKSLRLKAHQAGMSVRVLEAYLTVIRPWGTITCLLTDLPHHSGTKLYLFLINSNLLSVTAYSFGFLLSIFAHFDVLFHFITFC